MNYLIIEDETHNASLLKSLVDKIDPSAYQLDVLPTVMESIDWLLANPVPDVIFMDIRLSDGLSFEIFSKVNIMSPVIFTTAYDEYAIQAFKVYGAAYLLKPIEKEELSEALQKVQRFQPKLFGDEVGAIMEMFRSHEKTYKRRFLLHYRDTYKVIDVKEIDYITMEHKNVNFHIKDGSTLDVPYTMEELQEQLDPQFFFRVNRQYILHIGCIDTIHKYFNDRAKVVLKKDNQHEIIVSRTRMSQFKLWLNR